MVYRTKITGQWFIGQFPKLNSGLSPSTLAYSTLSLSTKTLAGTSIFIHILGWKKTATNFCSSRWQQVESFNTLLNLRRPSDLIWLRGRYSKYNASRGLKITLNRGLFFCCSWNTACLSHKEAQASQLENGRPCHSYLLTWPNNYQT